MENLKQRKGRVKIRRYLLDTLGLEELKLLFGNVYPINITYEGFDDYTYYCISEHFGIVKEGEIIPEYVVSLHIDENGKKTIEFTKL